jgi:hypothetical protein
MAKTLASQARNGGSIPLARSQSTRSSTTTALRRVARYQAWLAPQCGQSTEVETSALKAYPQWQE